MKRRLLDQASEWGPALVALVLFLAHPWRGLSLWGLWLVEQAERIEAWRAAPSDDLARAAFEGGAGLLPLPAMTAAWFSDGDGLLTALRVLGAVAAALFVWACAALGREVGGRTAAVAAGLLTLTVPRVLAMGTAVSPTVFTAASIAVLAVVWLRARRSSAWLVATVPATGVALATSAYGWFALVPALVVFYLDLSRRPFRGEVEIRPATPLALAAPVLGAALAVALVPWWHHETADRLGAALRFWLERPAEPTLFDGMLYGARRIPLRAPAVIVAVTTPLVVLAAAACGLAWASVRRKGAGSAALFVWGGFALFLPVLLRSVWHGGNDLLVLSVPPMCAAAGACVAAGARSFGTLAGRRPAMLSAMVVGIAVAGSGLGAMSAGARYESWYGGVIGGVEGAVSRGYSRWAHAPVPPELGPMLAGDRASVRVAIVSNAWEVAPVLTWYARHGIVGVPIELTDIAAADVVLAVYDDGLPELYVVARDVSWLSESDGAQVVRGQHDMPVLVVAPVR